MDGGTRKYERAVGGGTGMYSGASGVQVQSTIGFVNADLLVEDIPLVGFVFSVELPRSAATCL